MQKKAVRFMWHKYSQYYTAIWVKLEFWLMYLSIFRKLFGVCFCHSLYYYWQPLRAALCPLPAFTSQRHDHFWKIEPSMVTTNRNKYSPLSLCINDWNSLPRDLVTNSPDESFRNKCKPTFVMPSDLTCVMNCLTVLLFLIVI